MFSWFRQKKDPSPPSGPGNPGVGSKVRVAFSSGDKSWTEETDVVGLAERSLNQHGHATAADETSLTLHESGLVVRPQFLQLVPLDRGGVRTVTTVEVRHPDLIPGGLFEYQHSWGENLEDSIVKGFDQWAEVDLVPLLDASRPKPEECMMLGMSFPAQDGRPARHRRAILGPVAHLQTEPPGGPEGAEGEERHPPFCACCLLTNSFEAFKGLIEGDQFLGIRLFASRDAQGQTQADCRVNGEDWEPGARALRKYAESWPAAGYEFRKQYVVLRSVPGPENDPG